MLQRHMANELELAIRQLCLAFPEAVEFSSHGMANFRISGGKSFAIYSVNHHGDGRIALWLNAPDGVPDTYVRAEPAQFFVPPYVGPRGWVGVRLDRGIAWKRLAPLVRMAYEQVAPSRLIRLLGETPRIRARLTAMRDAGA
jgi:hypothetical protein